MNFSKQSCHTLLSVVRVFGVHEQEHQEICCKSFPGYASHTHAAGCQRRAFCKDLTCIHSQNPSLNKNLLCPHFSYPTRGQEHKLYMGHSWFICCTTAKCSEMGRTCQACRQYVGCFRQCSMGCWWLSVCCPGPAD